MLFLKYVQIKLKNMGALHIFDSATKNTVICFEQMFVIVAWIGPFNRIGIILSIITILCLLFFPYKRNPFYDLQKDGIDMMKKDFGSFLDK